MTTDATNTNTDTTTTTATDTGATPPTDTSTATTTPSESTATTDGQEAGEGATPPTDAPTDAPSTDTEDAPQTDAEGAPETYEAFTLPEGVTLEGERLEQAQAFFKAQGWSQQRSQDVVDAYMQFRGEEHAAERTLWAEMSEQEFGSNFAPIAEGAQRAIVAVEKVRPGITARLDATNLGNHPDVLWLFSKFGELTQERPLLGLGGESSTPAAPKSVASRMYPDLK